jgi:hypothetical protein
VTDLALIDLVGFWIGIFLTLCILSFLYKDNPFYKLGEHLFIGTSLGYIIVTQWETNLKLKLVDNFSWLTLIPIVLVALLFVRVVSKQFAWVGRYPLAFMISLYAGLQINAMAESDLAVQIKRSAGTIEAEKVDLNSAEVPDLAALPGASGAVAAKLIEERTKQPFTSVDDALSRPSLTESERASLAENRGGLVGIDSQADVTPGQVDWFGVVSNVLLLLGMLASLLYFYFSLAHKGVVGKVSRFGVWTLMIGFGASFGFTVQGRIALAIGRAQDVMGTFRPARHAQQINGPLVALISALVIIAGIVVWERRSKRAGTPAAPAAG